MMRFIFISSFLPFATGGQEIMKLKPDRNSFIANRIIVGTEELRPSLIRYLDRIEKHLFPILR